jgi:hypothetical protein
LLRVHAHTLTSDVCCFQLKLLHVARAPTATTESEPIDAVVERLTIALPRTLVVTFVNDMPVAPFER